MRKVTFALIHEERSAWGRASYERLGHAVTIDVADLSTALAVLRAFGSVLDEQSDYRSATAVVVKSDDGTRTRYGGEITPSSHYSLKELLGE